MDDPVEFVDSYRALGNMCEKVYQWIDAQDQKMAAVGDIDDFVARTPALQVDRLLIVRFRYRKQGFNWEHFCSSHTDGLLRFETDAGSKQWIRAMQPTFQRQGSDAASVVSASDDASTVDGGRWLTFLLAVAKLQRERAGRNPPQSLWVNNANVCATYYGIKGFPCKERCQADRNSAMAAHLIEKRQMPEGQTHVQIRLTRSGWDAVNLNSSAADEEDEQPARLGDVFEQHQLGLALTATAAVPTDV